VMNLFKEADVFCFPTSASEGFPKVVLEALTAGLPVITTRVSVLPSLLSSGCGVLLDDANPQSVAAAVIEVFSDQERYLEMSRKAIETAREYTLENWRDCIARFLEESWDVEPQLGTIRALNSGGLS